MSVKCGNRQVHGPEGGHHASAAEVKACFGFGPGPRTLDGLANGSQELRINLTPNVTPAPAELPHSIPVRGILYEGYFTVMFADGERRTIRVRRQSKDSDFKAGMLLVSYLSGPQNEVDYTTFGEVYENRGRAVKVRIWKKHRDNEVLMEAVRVLCGDPQAAAKAFAQESDHCSKCNRPLTVPQGPKSKGLNPYRDDGLGPQCGEEIFEGRAA